MAATKKCNHGISDSVDITYKCVVEDYINGTKAVAYGFWCHEHKRPGTWRTSDVVRKVEIPEQAES